MNLQNGYNYAKKVITTQECDMLILDEILGVVDEEVISFEDFKNLVDAKPDEMQIICTGRNLDERMRTIVDDISNIVLEK